VARAQQAGKVPTIGFLGSATPATQGQWVTAFVQRLRELGWVEGHNLAIDYRWAEGHNDRFPSLAADLVRRQVTVIAAIGGPNSALAAKAASKTAFRLPVFAPAYVWP
jgi:putative tryptophan/tyrosine transport system substrate-binding protein